MVSILTPLMFWLLLGAGLHGSVALPGGDAAAAVAGGADAAGESLGYLPFFFPGIIVMVLMFTAIFSTISVIEDRQFGFMQAVVSSPAPRLAIVLGKVMGGATIAWVQGVLFLGLWLLIGPATPVLMLLAAAGVMFLLAIALTATGLCFAWRSESTAGFHAVMNLVLMPMWFLSGAMFPPGQAPAIMQKLMILNPLTYGQAAFASLLTGLDGPSSFNGWSHNWWIHFAMTGLFALVSVGLAVRIVATPRKDGRL